MNAREICFAACFILFGSNSAFCWDGTNSNTGSSVEIERGQLVRPGRTVEVNDSTEGYKEYDVDSIRHSGRTVEIEVTDSATGESATLEMDGD
jgi:Family of unknown function (DUF5334)